MQQFLQTSVAVPPDDAAPRFVQQLLVETVGAYTSDAILVGLCPSQPGSKQRFDHTARYSAAFIGTFVSCIGECRDQKREPRLPGVFVRVVDQNDLLGYRHVSPQRDQLLQRCEMSLLNGDKHGPFLPRHTINPRPPLYEKRNQLVLPFVDGPFQTILRSLCVGGEERHHVVSLELQGEEEGTFRAPSLFVGPLFMRIETQFQENRNKVPPPFSDCREEKRLSLA
mmetsp:Transcript_47505/g.93691  ORF Transcript_47505/g.93691 Transcript_47505/m.93691 type:complete len:225 (-) Transcript_47505:97-771(-)